MHRDFGFVLKTIEDLTVCEGRENPHLLRVDEYLAHVNDFLNIQLWEMVKSTHPEFREFHVCCFLSDRSFSDGGDSRFNKHLGEFEVWCGVDKQTLLGLRFKKVQGIILTALLNSMSAVMRQKQMGGYENLTVAMDTVLAGLPRDRDRHRKSCLLLEKLSNR